MAWRSMVPGNEIQDLRGDRRNSVGTEQYKVSDRAVYMRGEYLPMSAIKDVMMQQSTYTPSCACGKGIPVYKIRIDYGAEKPVVLMIEKEKNAEKMFRKITDACPGASQGSEE